jgi:hypothetical protein
MTTAPKSVTREKHQVRIYTTDGWEIQGEVSIPAGGYNARLSDFLNSNHTFIALTDAVVYGGDGKLLTNQSFLSVNKQAIKLVIELEETAFIDESDNG